MYKKVISISLVAMAVMFTGCGNDDTTCRIDVQKAIDEGRYDDAIANMQGSCKNAFTQSDLNMNMAAAYMGKSGYSVSDIAEMLIDSDEQGDAFTSFLSSVADKKQPDSLPLLNKAGNYFLDAIATNGKSDISTLCSPESLSGNDARLTNACLYIGFNQTIKTANTITYLTGDVDKLVDSINDSASDTTPYDMRASLDALGWAVNTGYNLQSDTHISAATVTFSGNHTFADVNVTYTDTNGNEKLFYRLAKSINRDINNTTVITDGYCDVNGSKENCQGMEDETTGEIINPISGCHACPVVMDVNDSLSVSQLLVDTINNGADTISAVAGNDDVAQAVEDFKQEIIANRPNGDTNTTITVDDIINYLQQ